MSALAAQSLSFQLFNILKSKFTEAEAQEIVELVDSRVDEKIKSAVEASASPVMARLDSISGKFDKLEAKLDKDFASKRDLEVSKIDIIKWSLAMWFSVVTMVIVYILIRK